MHISFIIIFLFWCIFHHHFPLLMHISPSFQLALESPYLRLTRFHLRGGGPPRRTRIKKSMSGNSDNFRIFLNVQGVPKKTHFQNAAGATVHWLNHHLPAPLVSGDWFFGRFLLRLSRIKRPQVMSMVKFSPIALNFGCDFVLLVLFLGHPVCVFFSVWVCVLGKCVCVWGSVCVYIWEVCVYVWGVIGPWVGRVGGVRLGAGGPTMARWLAPPLLSKQP